MKNNNAQVICCGACAVTMNASGQTTTSIDALANGVRSFFSKVAGHHGANEATQIRA